MLQRWQSVFLFVAAALMAAFGCLALFDVPVIELSVPELSVGTAGRSVATLSIMLDALTVVLLLITIFKYRALKLQQRLCAVGALLIVTLLAVLAVVVFRLPADVTARPTPWLALPVVALFFTLWAKRRIRADRKLLSDSERIR